MTSCNFLFECSNEVKTAAANPVQEQRIKKIKATGGVQLLIGAKKSPVKKTPPEAEVMTPLPFSLVASEGYVSLEPRLSILDFVSQLWRKSDFSPKLRARQNLERKAWVQG